ncbi:MAG: tail fiber protein, partial [Gammaproteobacteria bacterium]
MATNYTPILANTPATPDALNAPLQELDDAIEGLVSGDKEMTSPNIASFHNAAHDHTDAAGGGLLPFDALDASGASDGDFLRISGGVVVATPIAVDIPVGSFIPYGGASAPAGWLLCDGSAVSRTTYADLFSIIGVTYGSGDGSTT